MLICTPSDAQTTPEIIFDAPLGRTYIIVNLDLDAPFPSFPFLGPILHCRSSIIFHSTLLLFTCTRSLTLHCRAPIWTHSHQSPRRHDHTLGYRHASHRILRGTWTTTSKRASPICLHAVRAARGLRCLEVLTCRPANGPFPTDAVRLPGI